MNIDPIQDVLVRQTIRCITKFIQSPLIKQMTVEVLRQELALKSDSLNTSVSDLHPDIQKTLQARCRKNSNYTCKGDMAKLSEGMFDFVARKELFAGYQLSILGVAHVQF